MWSTHPTPCWKYCVYVRRERTDVVLNPNTSADCFYCIAQGELLSDTYSSHRKHPEQQRMKSAPSFSPHSATKAT